MKTKLLLTAFLSLFATSAFSQSYEPFINFDKYWDIAYTNLESPFQETKTYRYKIDDSLMVVNNTECYRIVGRFASEQIQDIPALISEDTLLKQVYISYDFQNFGLLYDFNLEIGDTLFRNIAGQGTFPLVVEEIDSILFYDNSHRKAYRYKGENFPSEVFGFGEYNVTFFAPNRVWLGTNIITVCIGIEPDSLYGSCTYKNFNVLENSHIEITLYPNPASHAFTLNLENTNTLSRQELQLEIYNMQGQRCLRQTIAGGPMQHSIDVEALPAGLYFVELKNKSGKSLWREKLMIE